MAILWNIVVPQKTGDEKRKHIRNCSYEKKNRVVSLALLILWVIPLFFLEGSFFSVALAFDLFPKQVEKYLNRFNPIGNLANEVKEEIPKLTIKGFIKNHTDWNLHAKSNDVGLGHRVRDWRAQQIKWLTELKVYYQLTDHIEIVNVSHFMYDAFYDWQNTDSNANKINRDAEYYHETKRIIREFYVKAHYGGWDINVGKQQLVWGKMDGKFIDIINPEDFREGPQHEIGDYEWTRIPTWMLNATYNWADSYLNLIWIPDFEASRPPVYNSAYWLPSVRIYESTNSPFPPIIQRLTTDKPSKSFANNEFGLRYNIAKGIWDVSLIYFYTWDDLPTNFFRSGTIDPLSNQLSRMVVEPKHTRIHQLGLSTTSFFYRLNKQWIWRVEAMYTLNKYVGLKPMVGVLPWLAGKGNTAKRNTLKSATSIETTFFDGSITTVFQPVFNYIFGFDNNMNARHLETIFIWNSIQSIHYFDERIKHGFTLYCFPFSKMNGWKYKYDVTVLLSDYLSVIFRYTGYSGHDDEVFGMYDEWDNMGIELAYEF